MIEQKQRFERVAISKRLRFEVFKRDAFECQYCGAHPPSVILHCDHIIPVSEGGETNIDNLVTACAPCNLGKSNIPLTSVPQSLEDRAAEVAEREAQVAGYESVMRAKRKRLDENTEIVLDMYCDLWGQTGIRTDWFSSMKRFVELIGVDDCLEALDIAKRKAPWSHQKGFKYFCGVCWKKTRGE